MKKLKFDFAVAGAGLAGIAAALSAARKGLKVVLINDRGVLGGNASSEIGVGICGAGHHGLNPAIYSKESGIVDEIRMSIYKHEYNGGLGRHASVDAALFDLIYKEENITLLLNTLVLDAKKKGGKVVSVLARHSINETDYEIKADYFADCTGNGIVAAKVGCEYRQGREGKDVYNEFWAPEKTDSYTMGNTFYFEVEKKDHEVVYKKPDFAYDISGMDFVQWINKPENFRGFGVWGPHWAYEYGGQKDIIKDSEEIDLENRKLIFGIWDYVKNSGKYPQAKNASLKRVFARAGSRESRRFVGLYTLTENDIENKIDFEDSVAIGGWPMDIHAPLGIYDPTPASNFVAVTGTYNIPLRILCSKDYDNLFFAGRDISASHIALGSTRVMATCGSLGEAVGIGAYVAKTHGNCKSKDLCTKYIREIQDLLLKDDHTILHRSYGKLTNFKCEATSEKTYENTLMTDTMPLERDYALALPVDGERLDSVDVYVKCDADTKLNYKVILGTHPETYLPEYLKCEKTLEVKAGTDGYITFDVNESPDKDKKIYLVFTKNESISLGIAQKRTFGAVTLRMHTEESHDKKNHDSVPVDARTGYTFCDHFYEKERNIVFKNVKPNMHPFSADKVVNGESRPYGTPNLWIPDSLPASITLTKTGGESGREVVVIFDNELEMDTIYKMPAPMARSFTLKVEGDGKEQLFEDDDNFMRRRIFKTDFDVEKVVLTVKDTYSHEGGGVYSIIIR